MPWGFHASLDQEHQHQARTLDPACQQQVDSKKELEKQLKSVCEAFIMAVTKVRWLMHDDEQRQ